MLQDSNQSLVELPESTGDPPEIPEIRLRLVLVSRSMVEVDRLDAEASRSAAENRGPAIFLPRLLSSDPNTIW
jgi:hypothetical protein